MRVGYIVSRFPSTTETFIAREMAAVSDLGVEVSLFALVEQADALVQPEAAPFVSRVQAAKFRSVDFLAAQCYWLRKEPRAYLRVWNDALYGNIRSPRFLVRAFVVVPAAAWFARRARAQRLDHIHAHWATHSALAAWVVHRLTGLPYSITAHAHDIYVDRTMLETKLAEARFVAVISEYNRAFLAEIYPAIAGKLHVVRCGVDPQRFRTGAGGDNGGPLRLLCVASLQDYKGHHQLLRALALLKTSGFAVTLTVAGGGDLADDLAAQAVALDIADLVDWRGRVSTDEVAALLCKSDVVVLPSIITKSGKMEGIPVALMEALAAEVPVVASDISGISELVQPDHSGFLTPPGDAVALAAAIRGLADPELRRRFGAAGREVVEKEFSSAGNAERLVALIVDPTKPTAEIAVV